MIKNILSSTFALLLFGFFIFSHQSDAMEFALRSHSPSMEPIDIQFKGKFSLRIPKAYLAEVVNWTGGDQESVYIEAVLPDMRPLKASENLTIEENLVVTIRLDHLLTADIVEIKKEKLQKVKPYFAATGYGIDKLEPSYFEAVKKGEVFGMGFFPTDDVYIRPPDEEFFLVRCYKNKIGKCNAETYFSGKIMGNFSFDRKFIPENWREIDQKVDDLVDSFIVN